MSILISLILITGYLYINTMYIYLYKEVVLNSINTRIFIGNRIYAICLRSIYINKIRYKHPVIYTHKLMCYFK